MCTKGKRNKTGSIEVDFKHNKIKLAKLKWVKCKPHNKFDGKIRNMFRKMNVRKYKCIFNYEVIYEQGGFDW